MACCDSVGQARDFKDDSKPTPCYTTTTVALSEHFIYLVKNAQQTPYDLVKNMSKSEQQQT